MVVHILLIVLDSHQLVLSVDGLKDVLMNGLRRMMGSNCQNNRFYHPVNT